MLDDRALDILFRSARTHNAFTSTPVTAIVAYDTRFYDLLPRLFPHDQTARSWFAGEAKAPSTAIAALRNGSLQGAYFILAARALGFDCGPMSGFDNAKVDAAFFPDGQIKSNFLCNLGHGDPKGLFFVGEAEARAGNATEARALWGRLLARVDPKEALYKMIDERLKKLDPPR